MAADEVTIASFCKAVSTAVMARSANEEKKKNCHPPSIASK